MMTSPVAQDAIDERRYLAWTSLRVVVDADRDLGRSRSASPRMCRASGSRPLFARRPARLSIRLPKSLSVGARQKFGSRPCDEELPAAPFPGGEQARLLSKVDREIAAGFDGRRRLVWASFSGGKTGAADVSGAGRTRMSRNCSAATTCPFGTRGAGLPSVTTSTFRKYSDPGLARERGNVEADRSGSRPGRCRDSRSRPRPGASAVRRRASRRVSKRSRLMKAYAFG